MQTGADEKARCQNPQSCPSPAPEPVAQQSGLSIERFWEQSRRKYFLGPPNSLLSRQLVAAMNYRDDPQEQRALQIVGVATGREVDDLLHPLSYAIRQRRNHNGRR